MPSYADASPFSCRSALIDLLANSAYAWRPTSEGVGMTEEGQRPARCALCHKAVDPQYRPFCSGRCADLDLGNWLIGSYAIPSAEPLTFGEEEELDQALQSFQEDWAEPS